MKIWRITVGVLCLGLLVWLAMSPTSPERRVALINAAFDDGRLGPLREPFERKLRAQMEWLVHAAGMDEPVFVNQGVHLGRLDVIVTTPEVRAYTECGPGNALYSPDLDAIFIDRNLVLPEEIFIIGESYAGSLIDLENSDFHYSYLNFILAHELGHRQHPHAGGRPSAFFHYSALGGGAGNQAIEKAADDYAVETLMNGVLTLGPLDFLETDDILELLGLDLVEIDRKDRATAEIVGAVQIMSLVLLFSGSPYSPFHFDKEHPSFIERSLAAIDRVSRTPNSKRTAAHLSYFTAQAMAFDRLADFGFKEIYFDDPVFRIDYRDGYLWFGTHSLPALNQARIFKVALSEISIQDTITQGPVFAHFSKLSDLERSVDAVDWLETVFDPHGAKSWMADKFSPHPESILPPAASPTDLPPLLLPPEYHSLVQEEGLRVENAVQVRSDWFIPGFPPHGASAPQRWTLWRYTPDGSPKELVEVPFLISKVIGPAEGSFLRDLDPYLEGILPLSDGWLVVWFRNDSMYLVNPYQGELALLFTPIIQGLQVLEIPPSNLIIWALNGKKAYVAEFKKHGLNDES